MRADFRASATPGADTADGAPPIPRWPVEIVADTADPGALPATPPTCSGPPDFSDPRYQPFDWGSAMALLDSLGAELAWQHQAIAALRDPAAPDATSDGFLSNLAATQGALNALSDELRKARDHHMPFSPELRELLMRGLASLSLNAPAADDGTFQTATPLLADPQMRQAAFHSLDHHARRLYTDRPEDLPCPQRDMFERHWSDLARQEFGEMGGEPLSDDSASLTILRLPVSRLVGWSFGTAGEYHITLPSERVASGNLDIGGDPPSTPAASHPTDKS